MHSIIRSHLATGAIDGGVVATTGPKYFSEEHHRLAYQKTEVPPSSARQLPSHAEYRRPSFGRSASDHYDSTPYRSNTSYYENRMGYRHAGGVEDRVVTEPPTPASSTSNGALYRRHQEYTNNGYRDNNVGRSVDGGRNSPRDDRLYAAEIGNAYRKPSLVDLQRRKESFTPAASEPAIKKEEENLPSMSSFLRPNALISSIAATSSKERLYQRSDSTSPRSDEDYRRHQRLHERLLLARAASMGASHDSSRGEEFSRPPNMLPSTSIKGSTAYPTDEAVAAAATLHGFPRSNSSTPQGSGYSGYGYPPSRRDSGGSHGSSQDEYEHHQNPHQTTMRFSQHPHHLHNAYKRSYDEFHQSHSFGGNRNLEMEVDEDVGTPTNDDSPKKIQRTSRYLREIDRRMILQRIDAGEKQSVLAKEYQVSRAAICNLNKNRDEVLTRVQQDPFAKHPKKPRKKLPQGNIKHLSKLHVLDTKAISFLMTRLRDAKTSTAQFQRTADRAIRLLLEDALANVEHSKQEITQQNGDSFEGMVQQFTPCALTLELNHHANDGGAMGKNFQQIEPDAPLGTVSFLVPDVTSTSTATTTTDIASNTTAISATYATVVDQVKIQLDTKKKESQHDEDDEHTEDEDISASSTANVQVSTDNTTKSTTTSSTDTPHSPTITTASTDTTSLSPKFPTQKPQPPSEIVNKPLPPQAVLNDLPPTAAKDFTIFLLDTVTSCRGTRAAIAIQALLDAGIEATRIHFISLLTSASALEFLIERFPGVHVKTALVDPLLEKESGVDVEAYFSSKYYSQE